MNKILLPNLFFEEELQTIATTGSPQARRLANELGPVMGLLSVEEADRSIVIVDSDAKPDEIPPALQRVEFLSLDEAATTVHNENPSTWNVVPWGWSESAATILLKTFATETIIEWPGLNGISSPPRGLLHSAQSSPRILMAVNSHGGHAFEAPDINAVRRINSRQFQAKCDAAVAINGSDRIDAFGTLCHSLSQVEAAIQAAGDFSSHGWVIKADLSHASRNRLLGNSPELRREHLAWLESRFANGECVYVEPWVERIAECGLQFQITPSATNSDIEFIGAAEMLTDDAGRYRGSVVRHNQAPDTRHNTVWQPAVEHCLQIAAVAVEEGYFGPIGFDCMIFRYPKNNCHWLRLSHDINGRMTMGRVALSLKRHLKPSETGVWLHTSDKSLQQSWKGSDDISRGDVRIEQTSPGLIGGKPAKTVTAFAVSDNSDQLQAACTRILGQTVRMPTLRRSIPESLLGSSD